MTASQVIDDRFLIEDGVDSAETSSKWMQLIINNISKMNVKAREITIV